MAIALAHYETLYWISRLNTFRAAADFLSVSQPTVSLRIREMERELSVKLFERSGRMAVLTDDGRTAAEYAGQILALSRDLTFRVRRHDTLHGTIRIGIPDALAIVYLPRILLELERTSPELKVAVRVESSDALARRLAGAEIDAAIVVGLLPTDMARQDALIINEPIWVASSGFLPAGVSYGPHDLINARVFTTTAPSSMYGMVTGWFDVAGVRPLNLCNCSNVAAIRSLAEAGICLAVLPRSFVADSLADGRLVELQTTHQVPRETIYFSVPRLSTNPAIPILREATMRVLAPQDAKATASSAQSASR